MYRQHSAGTNEVDRLILEVMLVQLKKSADWWLGGGIFLIIWAGIGFPFIFLFSIPIFVMGLLILLYGFNLRKKWFVLVKRRQREELAEEKPGGPGNLRRNI